MDDQDQTQNAGNQDESPVVQMYCVKCREKRDADDIEHVTMKNGKPAMKAKCSVCETTMFRIGKAEPAE